MVAAPEWPFSRLSGRLLVGLGPDFACRRAATTERVVVNRYSRRWPSRASTPWPISPMPRPSRARRLSRRPHAGAVWRFRNEGNRAAFVAHPEIYGPQFGGYDPVDLGARRDLSRAIRGSSLVTGQRLYLFGREDNRDAFAADPARFLKDARARWPALQDNLAQ